uniref:Uncharacterized protein n=1 Tax=Anopheles atroparvus TaxID=41427 RepID=A0A182J488_ANOAO
MMMMVTTTAEDDGCGPSSNGRETAIASNYCDNLSAADEADGEEEEEEDEENEEHNEAGQQQHHLHHEHLLMNANSIGHLECTEENEEEVGEPLEEDQYGQHDHLDHERQQEQHQQQLQIGGRSEEDDEDGPPGSFVLDHQQMQQLQQQFQLTGTQGVHQHQQLQQQDGMIHGHPQGITTGTHHLLLAGADVGMTFDEGCTSELIADGVDCVLQGECEEEEPEEQLDGEEVYPGPAGDSMDSEPDGQMHQSLHQHAGMVHHQQQQQHYQNHHHQLVEKYIEEVDGSGGGSVGATGAGSGGAGYVLETTGGEMISTEIVEHNHHDHGTVMVEEQDTQEQQQQRRRRSMVVEEEPVESRQEEPVNGGEILSEADDGATGAGEGALLENNRLLDVNDDGLLHEVGTIVEVQHEEEHHHQEEELGQQQEPNQKEQQRQPRDGRDVPNMIIDGGMGVAMVHPVAQRSLPEVLVTRQQQQQHQQQLPPASVSKSSVPTEHFLPTSTNTTNNVPAASAARRTTTILVVEDCIATNGVDHHQHNLPPFQHQPVRYGRRPSIDAEGNGRMTRNLLPLKFVPECGAGGGGATLVKKSFPEPLDLYLVESGSVESVAGRAAVMGGVRCGGSVVRPGGEEALAPCGDWPQFKMKMMDTSKMLVVDHHQLVDGSNSIILSPIGTAGTPTMASSPGATSLQASNLLAGQQPQLQTLHQHMVSTSQQQQQQQQQHHTIQQQSPTTIPMTAATLVQQIAAQNHHQQQQLHPNAAATTAGISFLAHHHHPQQPGAATVINPQQQQQPTQQQQQGMSIFQLQASVQQQQQQPHGNGQTALGGVATTVTSHPVTVGGSSAIQLTSEASAVIKPFFTLPTCVRVHGICFGKLAILRLI